MITKAERAETRARLNPRPNILISDFKNYCFEKGEYHYIYNGFDFLYKNQQKENIVVLFHGSVPNKFTQRFTFRGYDYNFDNADILCMSDYLIKTNDELLLSWYLSTSNNNYLETYSQIINKILQHKYCKVVFTGTSGGGFPSLIFGSLFKGYSLISNSQIYLDKYYYFDNMLSLLNLKKDDINYNIEKFILDNGPPLKTILYTNKRDNNHYINHSIPFKKFMEENFPNQIETIFFDGRDPPLEKSSHHVQFPGIEEYYQVIKNILTP